MTPDELSQAAVQTADLASVLDSHGLDRLGTDAACVAYQALQSLTHLLSETSVIDTPRDLGAARFPGVRPDELYSDPLPVTSTMTAHENPHRIPLTDARPGVDNGPTGLGVLVSPSADLVETIETLGGAPMLADAGRPRQCSLRLQVIGEDEVLVLVVRFVPHLLTVWREGETYQRQRASIMPGGRAAVRGVYPTWPRQYRVRYLGRHPSPFEAFDILLEDGRAPGIHGNDDPRAKAEDDPVQRAQAAELLQQQAPAAESTDG